MGINTDSQKWNQIVSIAEEQIGKNYFSETDPTEFASSDTSNVLFVAVINQKAETVLCKPLTETSESETILGFIRGHITTVPEFTYNRFSADMGPLTDEGTIFEVTTWAVTEQYREQGIGLKLIKIMTDHIQDCDVYPVVSAVRKVNQEGVENTAFEFLAQYGETVQILDSKPHKEIVCAKCGKNCSCQTVILSYTESDISELQTQTIQILSS